MKIIAHAPLGMEPDISLGPSAIFMVLGASLFIGLDETPTAQWISHQWAVRGKLYTTLEVSEPVTVTFVGGPVDIPSIGPFKAIRLSDGSLIGDDVILARFNAASSHWSTNIKVDCAGFQLEPYAPTAG